MSAGLAGRRGAARRGAARPARRGAPLPRQLVELRGDLEVRLGQTTG
jgi:hypothetical protein